jgi:hypothetical protein
MARTKKSTAPEGEELQPPVTEHQASQNKLTLSNPSELTVKTPAPQAVKQGKFTIIYN